MTGAVGRRRDHIHAHAVIAERFLLALGLLLVLAGVTVPGLMLADPLPRFATAIGDGYCGPGYESSSAARVLLDPGVVNIGPDGRTQVGPLSDELRSYCTARAHERLELAAVVGSPVLVSGMAITIGSLLSSGLRRRGSGGGDHV